MKNTTPEIVFLLSHPIQYFSPMMAGLSKEWGDKFEVWYCSDVGLKAHLDEGFGVQYQWDIPLLEGYKSRFFRNYSVRPSVASFFGLFNPTLILSLLQNRPKILIVHGWGYSTHIFAILLAYVFGINIWLRAETPLNQEEMKTGFIQKMKRSLLKYGLFSIIDKFLYIGSRNKAFFKQLGAKEEQLIFTPYAVDNTNFYVGSKTDKLKLKKILGISTETPIVLFCGKLINKKRPDLLLQSSVLLKSIPHAILFVGAGEMQSELESFAEKNKLLVRFIGFKNQSELPSIYAGSDIFVLPSTIGETWGLVVNEAMASGLPVVVSDTTGCSPDLVSKGKNGFIFNDGDENSLAEALHPLIVDEEIRKTFGHVSKEIIDQYSIPVIVQNMIKAETR